MEAALSELVERPEAHERIAERARAKTSKPVSAAERRILNLAVKGYTDKEICKELGLSITTIRTHWTRLRRKLGVVNRAQAIAESMELESGEQLRMMQARVRAMHRALNMRGLGVWEWHPEADRVIADDLAMRLFNPTTEAEQFPLADFLESLPAEERHALSSHLREPKLNGGAEVFCHRVRLADARQAYVRTRATRMMVEDRALVLCTTETVAL